MTSSPMSTSRYAFTVLLPPSTTRSPIRMLPSWHRIAVRSPIHTSFPSSMWASPRRQEISALRPMFTIPVVLMWRFRMRSRHTYRRRNASRRRSSLKRLLGVHQEVVEGPLRQHAVQVALIEAVQREVRAVGEPSPPLAQQAGARPRLDRADRPANQGGGEFLGLGAHVGEPDLPARPLHRRGLERVEV